MMRVLFLTGSMGLLLGSASPPPRAAVVPHAVPPQIAGATVPHQNTLHATAPEPQEPTIPPVAPASSPQPALAEDLPAEEEQAAPLADLGPSGVRVVVSIPLQKAYVFENGELLWTAPVSTGKRGHATPVGTFPILQKKVHHRSSKYDNAPMPYMQRLTWYGIALHAGRVPGYPASHGCIRLPRSYAKKLYGITDSSTTVTITREKPRSADEALQIA